MKKTTSGSRLMAKKKQWYAIFVIALLSFLSPSVYSQVGTTCQNPIVVTGLPYTTTDNTANYADNYDPPTGTSPVCSTTTSGNWYHLGNDVIYAYTPPTNKSINIRMPSGVAWTGMFVYTDCANIGVEYAACATSTSSGNREINNFLVTGGQTYYILLSIWETPSTFAYTLNITENTCVNQAATFAPVSNCAVTPGFFATANITSLGSAASLTVTDNQGSTAQVVTATGLVTFGPYANGTSVVLTVANSTDVNCVLTSSAITQAACPPANDNCAEAVSLTVNPDMSCTATTSGTTVAATQSMAATPCNGNPDDDVWYKFVATQASHVITISDVVAVSGTSTDMYFQVLDGACGAGTSLLCSDPNTNLVSGLTPGNTYYVRVYSYATTSRQTFKICVATLPAAPANNECSAAVALTVSPDATCAATTPGTTLGATQSLAAAPCNGNPDDDVWYSFVATSPNHTITLSGVTAALGTSTDIYFQVLGGACGTATSLLCSDDNANSVTGLTVGSTYYIRVYSFTATSMQAFNICVTTPPAPPANDECAGAVTLTVNPDLTCTATTSGTTVNAFQSMAATPCNGNPDDDVWFKFVATSTVHRISLSDVVAVSGTSTDMYFQVLSGACGTNTSVVCSDDNTSTVTNLTIGETYYVRVYSYATSSRQTFKICVATPPTPPANDDCAGAVTLTVNPDLSCGVTATGTTVNAYQSMGAGVCGGTPDDDVWYKFVATQTTHVVAISNVSAVTGTSTDMYFQVLSGACGNTASVLCSDDNNNVVTGLTVGATYYVRVYSYGTTTRNTFTICVGSIPTVAPANNDCAGAVTLTVNADAACTAVTAGTTAGATLSMAAAPCNGNPDDDVWFKFVATNAVQRITISDVVAIMGSSTDMYFQVLSGDCTTSASLLCSDDNTNILTGLTVGTTYYVRVYSYGANYAQNFNICVSTPPTPPVNDDCAGAVTLTVNPDLTCTATTSGTTVDALQSMAAGTCSGNPDDDVWFKFVATSSVHRISLSDVAAVTGTSVDMYFQVLSGACGTTTSLLCSDDNSNTITGLTAGQTYYVRVYSYASSSRQTFKICVATPPPPPANDDCAGAVTLTVNPDLSCGVTTAGTTVAAYQSMGAGACGGTPDDDVWYKFVATQTTHVVAISNIAAVTGTSTDMYFQVLSGACGSTTSVLCSDDNNSMVTGLTVGNTYYVRVYSYGSTTRNTFNICVGTIPAAPANDDCAGAVTLTVNPTLACAATTAGTTAGATLSMAATPCSGTADDDVWFKFVATNAIHHVTISDVTAIAGVSTDMYFQVLSGACGTTTSLLCSDPNTNILTGLTIGTTYYVRVYGYGTTARQTFNICIGTPPPPPANDLCANAIALTTGADFATAKIVTTSVGATVTAANPTPACEASQFATTGKDIWFTAVVPASGKITIETRGNGDAAMTDTGVAAYSGTCTTMTPLGCNADDGDGDFSKLALTGLTPGQVILVRAWGYEGSSGAFDIAAYDPCAGTLAPTGNATQTLAPGQTLANLTVTGTGLIWYSNAGLTTTVPNTTVAVNGATYYVTQTVGGCVSPALAITVNVVDPCAGTLAPTGNAAQTLAPGQTLANLTVTGTNLIWYSNVGLTTTVPNTTVAATGTTYYVTQTVGTCVSPALAITVTIVDPCAGTLAPTGNAAQTLAPGQTLANLTVTGTNLVWYSNVGLTTVVPNTTVAVTGTTYYVTQTVGTCVSPALAITVTIVDPCAGTLAPTGNTAQTLAPGQTLANLTVTGTNLVWYSNVGLTTVVPNTTVAVTGTTYYVTQTVGTCVSPALAVTVTIVDPCAGTLAPTGNAAQTLAPGQTLANLTVTGTNLVWYSDAALTTVVPNTTAAVTGTTYYVTQTVGTCVSPALAVTVTVVDPCEGIQIPAGDENQDFNTGETLADLNITGTNLVWYADAALTIVLPDTTVLTDATTYYATQTVGACTSGAIGVTVNEILGRNDFDSASFSYYPNPVIDVLNLSYSNDITEVAVYNTLGQSVLVKTVNATEAAIDLSNLAAATYIVKVTAGDVSKTIRIVKK